MHVSIFISVVFVSVFTRYTGDPMFVVGLPLLWKLIARQTL